MREGGYLCVCSQVRITGMSLSLHSNIPHVITIGGGASPPFPATSGSPSFTAFASAATGGVRRKETESLSATHSPLPKKSPGRCR